MGSRSAAETTNVAANESRASAYADEAEKEKAEEGTASSAAEEGIASSAASSSSRPPSSSSLSRRIAWTLARRSCCGEVSHEGGESVVDEFSERIVWRGVRGRSNVRRELQSAFASEVCLEPIAHAHRVEDATTPKNRRRVEFGDGTETRTGTRGGSLRGSLRGAWIAGVAGGVALVVGASPIVLAHLHDLGGEIDPTTNPRLVRIRRGTRRPRRRRGVRRRRRGRSVRSARLRFRTLPRAAHALPDHLLDHLDVARPGASLGASSSPPRGSPGVSAAHPRPAHTTSNDPISRGRLARR